MSLEPALARADTGSSSQADLQCCICMETRDERAKLPDCIHIFCFECINKWKEVRTHARPRTDPRGMRTDHGLGATVTAMVDHQHLPAVQATLR